MKKQEDKNTRYFLDLDLRTRTVFHWGYDQKDRLAGQELAEPFYHRVFISKGQYIKLDQRDVELDGER